jgi:hypothetical protein
MFACSLHAEAVVPDRTDFMRRPEMGMNAFEMIEKVHFKAIPTEFEFLARFYDKALAALRSNESAGEPLSDSAHFKYHANSGSYTPTVSGARADGPDLDQSRLEMSDEPIPTIAVLVLIGLVAFIALNRRRK